MSKTSSRGEDPGLQFMHRRIRQLLEKREHQHVVTWCTSLIARFPKLAILYRHRAEAQHLLERDQQALHDIDIAVRLAPQEPAHLFRRATWRLELGAYERTVADLTATMHLEEQLGASRYSTSARCLRALAQIMLGHFDEAKRDVERLPPDSREFARGRVWTASALTRCIATKRRPTHLFKNERAPS